MSSNSVKQNRPSAGYIMIGCGAVLAGLTLIGTLIKWFPFAIEDYIVAAAFIVLGVVLLKKYVKSFGWAVVASIALGGIVNSAMAFDIKKLCIFIAAMVVSVIMLIMKNKKEG